MKLQLDTIYHKWKCDKVIKVKLQLKCCYFVVNVYYTSTFNLFILIDGCNKSQKKTERKRKDTRTRRSNFVIRVEREEYHEDFLKKFQKLKQELFFKDNALFLEWLLDVAASTILGNEEKSAFVISANKAKSIIWEDKLYLKWLFQLSLVYQFSHY